MFCFCFIAHSNVFHTPNFFYEIRNISEELHAIQKLFSHILTITLTDIYLFLKSAYFQKKIWICVSQFTQRSLLYTLWPPSLLRLRLHFYFAQLLQFLVSFDKTAPPLQSFTRRAHIGVRRRERIDQPFSVHCTILLFLASIKTHLVLFTPVSQHKIRWEANKPSKI